MYIDGVIVFSLLMIALILVMMAYIGIYFYRHIQRDTALAEKACQRCDNCECDKQIISTEGLEKLA